MHRSQSSKAAFPPADKLGRYFHFSVSLYQVNAPDGLQADLITTADHEAIIQARAQAASHARSRIAAGVEDFVQDCVANLREQTADLCNEMLAAMRTGKTGVHQKTLNRLVDFIDKVNALNFKGQTSRDRITGLAAEPLSHQPMGEASRHTGRRFPFSLWIPDITEKHVGTSFRLWPTSARGRLPEAHVGPTCATWTHTANEPTHYPEAPLELKRPDIHA